MHDDVAHLTSKRDVIAPENGRHDNLSSLWDSPDFTEWSRFPGTMFQHSEDAAGAAKA